MTTHRGNYSGLSANSSYREMMAIEKNLSGRTLFHIEKTELAHFGSSIQNGDMIAITTGITGLDVVHVGLAVHNGNSIHLLHASETEKKVVISDTTLHEYLARRETMTGIIVAQVIQVCQNDDNLLMA